MLRYLVDPIFQVVNTAGKPATGGYIEVYLHGTRDKYYCASDFDGSLHPFKIPLDSLGANIILADDSNAYDIYVYNRYGSLLMSRYNVAVSNSGGGGEAIRKGTIHKIGLCAVEASDAPPKPNEYWVVDLESPNEDEPSGYDRLTVDKAREIHGAGSFFGLRTIVQNPHEDNLLLETNFEYIALNQTFGLKLAYIHSSAHVTEYTLSNFGAYVGVDYVNDATLVKDGDDILNHNKIHRLRPAYDSDIGETSHYGGWVFDMESPNENAPGGYDRLTPQKLKQILDNGEFLVMESYASGNYVPLALQALVDVQNQNPLRIRVDFVRQYTFDNLLGFAQMAIYTPIGDETYLQILGQGPIGSWWLDKEALAVNGDGSDVTATFTKAQTRANIDTNEKLSVLFGKIKKWLTDLKALAFKDKADLTQDVSGILPIANGGTNASTVAVARTNLDVYSKAEVNTAIDTAVASAYHAAGTKTVAQLTNSLLVAANQGNVYNITDSGTTTADFVDGAGHPINAGDNVVICKVGSAYKFDLLAGFVDLSDYLSKTGDGSDVTSTLTKNASDSSAMSSGGKLSALFTAISDKFGSLKALAFKASVGTSDISNDAVTADKVKDGETLPVDISGVAKQSYYASLDNVGSSGGWVKVCTCVKNEGGDEGCALLFSNADGVGEDRAITYYVSVSNRATSGVAAKRVTYTRLGDVIDTSSTARMSEFGYTADADDNITVYMKRPVYAGATRVTVLSRSGDCTLFFENVSGGAPSGYVQGTRYDMIVAENAGVAGVGSASVPVYVDTAGIVRECAGGRHALAPMSTDFSRSHTVSSAESTSGGFTESGLTVSLGTGFGRAKLDMNINITCSFATVNMAIPVKIGINDGAATKTYSGTLMAVRDVATKNFTLCHGLDNVTLTADTTYSVALYFLPGAIADGTSVSVKLVFNGWKY